MATYSVKSGEANVGTIDGVCTTCGSPRRRMGWHHYPDRYWLMCTGSMGTEELCKLPTLEDARKRLFITDKLKMEILEIVRNRKGDYMVVLEDFLDNL